MSPERDVSLSSGCMIANALIENGHNALLADLYMGILAVRNFADAYKKYKKDHYEYTVPEEEPDLDAVKAARAEGGDQQIGEGIIQVCSNADMTFLALHGDIGENGRLQAVFDVYGIAYTGTGYEGSFMAMDKPLAKELMRIHGIDTPDWTVFDTARADGAHSHNAHNRDDHSHDAHSRDAYNRDDHYRDALRSVGFPCFIKPCGCGSSVGVSLVNNYDELDAALRYAYKYEKRVMAEKKIAGREFSIGVLGGESLPPIEIIPRVGFFDYYNKYQNGGAHEVCPARDLPQSAEKAMRDAALKLHNILRLGDYSRLDVILSEDGKVYCLETNALPGMTPTSLLPKEAAAAGISYPQLCEKIVNLALARHAFGCC